LEYIYGNSDPKWPFERIEPKKLAEIDDCCSFAERADAFSYDVSADGQKFLINTRVNEPIAPPLAIILNWASEMEK
jgi:hypothetical protein